ncbi:MAG: DUF1573 domain-containing protein [Chloroflexi bacterium]|nr:DUF1573 domain-containing protein [Chloroflexota bacterium]
MMNTTFRSRFILSPKRLVFLLLALFALWLSACSAGQPRLALETNAFDFGDIPYGEVVSRDLVVKNEGSAPLVVESVSTTCGCTTASLEPMTIPPGGSAKLHIEFNSAAHGPESAGLQTRQVFLANNDPEQPDAMVEFRVNVLPPSSS